MQVLFTTCSSVRGLDFHPWLIGRWKCHHSGYAARRRPNERLADRWQHVSATCFATKHTKVAGNFLMSCYIAALMCCMESWSALLIGSRNQLAQARSADATLPISTNGLRNPLS